VKQYLLTLVLSCAVLGPVLVPQADPQAPATSATRPSGAAEIFGDITQRLGVNFRHQASHTSKKYLPETMGAGVALFDYDNDGRLDIFPTVLWRTWGKLLGDSAAVPPCSTARSTTAISSNFDRELEDQNRLARSGESGIKRITTRAISYGRFCSDH
jgi:hypothetical protein